MASTSHSELRLTRFLESSVQSDDRRDSAALIVLNSPISDLDYFRTLYKHCAYCVCADGGANRLHDLISQHVGDADDQTRFDHEISRQLPDVIHGDLDSLRDDVRQRYEKAGVVVSRDPDQYSTDFGKAVKLIRAERPHVTDILILGSLGGRVDQGVGLLHELYREQQIRHTGLRFWLFSEASVSTLLRSGTTVLHTPLSQGLIRESVGILPIYGPAVISTNGLEWDVQDWATSMGTQVSTSNHIVADRIAVTTDREVLFTVERATRPKHDRSTEQNTK